MSLNTTDSTSSSDPEIDQPEPEESAAPHDDRPAEPVIEVVEEKVRDYRLIRRILLTLWAVFLIGAAAVRPSRPGQAPASASA